MTSKWLAVLRRRKGRPADVLTKTRSEKRTKRYTLSKSLSFTYKYARGKAALYESALYAKTEVMAGVVDAELA